MPCWQIFHWYRIRMHSPTDAVLRYIVPTVLSLTTLSRSLTTPPPHKHAEIMEISWRLSETIFKASVNHLVWGVNHTKLSSVDSDEALLSLHAYLRLEQRREKASRGLSLVWLNIIQRFFERNTLMLRMDTSCRVSGMTFRESWVSQRCTKTYSSYTSA